MFPVIMRAKETGLVIEFHNETDGLVLDSGMEPWEVGRFEKGFISYDNDWWEPMPAKISLPDHLFEI